MIQFLRKDFYYKNHSIKCDIYPFKKKKIKNKTKLNKRAGKMKRTLITIAFIIDLTLAMNLKLRQWNEFKSMNSLAHLNGSEEIRRSRIFFKNLNEINQHNTKTKQGLESYTMDVNKFSHLEWSEVVGNYAGLNHKKSSKLNTSSSRIVKQLNLKTKYSSTSFDLRNTGFVGAIKDQGRCG